MVRPCLTLFLSLCGLTAEPSRIVIVHTETPPSNSQEMQFRELFIQLYEDSLLHSELCY